MVKIEIIFLASLFALLIGYIWGRKIGNQEGFNQGLASAPMHIRERSLLEGKCLICNEEVFSHIPHDDPWHLFDDSLGN
jgi:hypothetical protein